MHLLNTTTLKLKYFIEDIPLYAILSHTWGDEEVTFDDIDKPHAVDMKGYHKILKSCAQALEDGYEWIWVDTCCIDKKSSAELSEAINSMYKWYWNADICYVYLSDFLSDTASETFVQSAWFTRGWTLQELLAPATVEFYSDKWKRLGTKSSLVDALHYATRIEKEFILNRRNIGRACIGKKFSWASRRKTTRTEDMAYSLLGLFGINMPLLYGEGSRAFYRLQLEIMKQSSDRTIFVWQPPAWGYLSRHRHDKTLLNAAKAPDQRIMDILAPAPSYFSIHRGLEIQPWNYNSTEGLTYEMTNQGLRIKLPVIKFDNDEVLALLNCRRLNDNRDYRAYCIGVPLLFERATQRYARTRKPFEWLDEAQIEGSEMTKMFLQQTHTAFSSADTANGTTMPVPFMMRVSSLQIWDIPENLFEEVKISFGALEPGFQGLHELHRLPMRLKDGVLLMNRMCGGVVINRGDKAISIIFGHDEGLPYIRLLPYEKYSKREEKTWEHEWVSQIFRGTAYRRDFLEEKVLGWSVIVSARETRGRDYACWKLDIEVWETAAGKPDARACSTERSCYHYI
jgi:hypothetical protein